MVPTVEISSTCGRRAVAEKVKGRNDRVRREGKREERESDGGEEREGIKI